MHSPDDFIHGAGTGLVLSSILQFCDFNLSVGRLTSVFSAVAMSHSKKIHFFTDLFCNFSMNFQFHQALRWRIGILRLRINPSQGI
jgi:hypothetical protein